MFVVIFHFYVGLARPTGRSGDTVLTVTVPEVEGESGVFVCQSQAKDDQ